MKIHIFYSCWYRLRRLKCKVCNKLHTELPESVSILDTLDEKKDNCCRAEEFTLYRWRSDWARTKATIESLLIACWMNETRKSYPLYHDSLLETIQKSELSWLAYVMRIATSRVMMITPLLDASLDPHQLIQRKKEISEKHHVSYRTIDRYYQAYLTKGFEGLKPKIFYKQSESSLPENYSEIVEQSIQLRKECPTRSVKDIIKILELETVVPVGVLSRSTLQRHLQGSGFGARQVQMYQKKGTASRRFQKQHRGNLYQGDIKYGPYLPIGKDGAKKQVYLSAWIDDATRYIVSAKFYDNQTVDIIEDSLRNAIMHFGKPDAIFVDNGKQYRSEWMKKACAKLGIRLLFAKPYHPEGKGKIEFFNRRMDAFLSEVALDKVETLEQLNQNLDLWINEYYHKNPHYGLGQISPETAFRTDTRPLSY